MVTVDNVFEKIVTGELPCHRVYEDDRVLAFLDLHPIVVGHTLLIPKRKALTVADLPLEDAEAIGRVLPRLVAVVQKTVGAVGCNILQNNGAPAGQVVRHVHFHLIPCLSSGERLLFEWPKRSLDADTGRALAERMTAEMTRLASGSAS